MLREPINRRTVALRRLGIMLVQPKRPDEYQPPRDAGEVAALIDRANAEAARQLRDLLQPRLSDGVRQ